MSAHLHIATLPDEELRPAYLIGQLAGLWREQGHRVTVGPTARLEADVGLLHIDRTRVSGGCLPANPDRRPLLNASVLDISKRRISTQLLSPDSVYAGPVIIKTDANAFGGPERRALPVWSLRRCRRRWSGTRWWRLVRELPRISYPVLDNLSRVPGWVWRRDDLVVERFLPEREGDEYTLRVWLFFGDQEYGARLFSREPVVKVRSITRYEYLDSVPDSLRAFRRRLGMDFGKIDYVMVDGETVPLDANKTPMVSLGRAPSPNLVRLAAGLSAYLGGNR